MLPIKKFYIDSRFKTSSSETHSNFTIDFPMTLLMPEDTGFYIEDVCIPHSWYPINAGNNYLQVKYFNSTPKDITIDPGNYSVRDLNEAIVAKMNAAYSGLGEVFAMDYDSKTNTIGIKLKTATVGTTFKIYTDNEFTVPANKTRSLNTMLKNFTEDSFEGTEVFRSGFVDMYPLRNIYLSCSGLGNFNTMSVSGDRNIINNIPVNAGYGDVIYYESATGLDYLDCSHQTLSRVSFQLRDIFGNIIDLNGAHISFSIVFSRVQNGS